MIHYIDRKKKRYGRRTRVFTNKNKISNTPKRLTFTASKVQKLSLAARYLSLARANALAHSCLALRETVFGALNRQLLPSIEACIFW